jgi:muramoyltetrapeptide carboxypeptidase
MTTMRHLCDEPLRARGLKAAPLAQKRRKAAWNDDYRANVVFGWVIYTRAPWTLDVIAMLCGSAYGDLAGFARDYAPEGLLVYLDNCDFNTAQYGRALHHLKLAGWFNAANAILIGRTAAEAVEGFTQRDALVDALGDLDIPILYDLDIGHLPPQLMLVNGALATLTFGPSEKRIDQTLA